jgi:hypothetical protein
VFKSARSPILPTSAVVGFFSCSSDLEAWTDSEIIELQTRVIRKLLDHDD